MAYRILRNGRVTLPDWLLQRLGLAPGDRVNVRLNDRGECVIEKAPPEPERPRPRTRPAR
jgi:bifunctional DNA-binding transcriptional regulator/antitoxin component of YhaV-PrlF toxin-antitoxin module